MDCYNASTMCFEDDCSVVQPEFVGYLPSRKETLVFGAVFALYLIWLWPPKSAADKPEKKTAPGIAWSIPIVRSTISFLFNGHKMFQEIPRLFPNDECVRIDIVQDELYAIKGPKTVAEVFRNPVLTNNAAYSLFLEHCYGMDKDAAQVFTQDASGLRHKPIEGAVVPEERIYHKTHQNLLDGLLGKGLPTLMESMERNLFKTLQDLPVGNEWVQMPSITSFFEQIVGTPLIRTLYGRRLVEEHPEFMDYLWAFDHSILSLLRRLPSFLFPAGYAVRKRLLATIKSWQLSCATSDSTETSTTPYEDPVWGTKLMKDRYNLFLGARKQTQDSIASMNLGLFWGTVVNVVPTAEALTINVLQAPGVCEAVRKELAAVATNSTTHGLDMEKVEKIPLVRSTFAETLRYVLQIHVPRVAKHHEVQINGVTIPQNKLILTNMMLAHMDTKVWNTQNGKHPVDSFWAERFIVDPQDPTSGPVVSDISKKLKYPSDELHFSTQGLDGAYFPFGGGKFACPGRHLARRVILSSLAMLITHFDIELVTDQPVQFHSPRFGLSVQAPKGEVPFRIRRRSSE